MKSQRKPGTPGGLEKEVLLASELIQGSAHSPSPPWGIADLFQGLLEHTGSLRLSPVAFVGVTCLGARVCRFRSLYRHEKPFAPGEMVAHLETGKEHEASLEGLSREPGGTQRC